MGNQHTGQSALFAGYTPWPLKPEIFYGVLTRQTSYNSTQALLLAGMLLGSGCVFLGYAIAQVVAIRSQAR